MIEFYDLYKIVYYYKPDIVPQCIDWDAFLDGLETSYKASINESNYGNTNVLEDRFEMFHFETMETFHFENHKSFRNTIER